jgi:hypothetical protein
MKRIFTFCLALCGFITSFAQTDTTGKQSSDKVDTIKIGGMNIIRKHGAARSSDDNVNVTRRKYNKPTNISTNWWIFDLGFSNYVDHTNYSSAEAIAFAPGTSKDRLNAKTFKSRNFNVWFFMQRMNIAKHVLNLKYGLGLETNNYMFDDEKVRFHKNPTQITIDPTLDGARKNKLAADYLTVPLMLNINFKPRQEHSIGLSFGVSAGYLYSSRQKIKMDGHKNKLKDDFDMEKWKISYIGELLLGPVKLYGSYAAKSMWSKGLDQTPYTVGVRFANW